MSYVKSPRYQIFQLVSQMYQVSQLLSCVSQKQLNFTHQHIITSHTTHNYSIQWSVKKCFGKNVWTGYTNPSRNLTINVSALMKISVMRRGWKKERNKFLGVNLSGVTFTNGDKIGSILMIHGYMFRYISRRQLSDVCEVL